eukprot:391613-Prorocentrum_minimum.AAC.2
MNTPLLIHSTTDKAASHHAALSSVPRTTVSWRRVYALSPHLIGPRRGYMPSSLARLVRARASIPPSLCENGKRKPSTLTIDAHHNPPAAVLVRFAHHTGATRGCTLKVLCDACIDAAKDIGDDKYLDKDLECSNTSHRHGVRRGPALPCTP